MRTTKGEPPVRLAATQKDEPTEARTTNRNLIKPQPAQTAGLNFKVSAELKRDFKIEAAMHGLNQVELLQEMFALWKQSKG
jgi:hypothetical protein